MNELGEIDLAAVRREYTKGGLRRHDLTPNPLTLFELWMKQACEARLSDPTAMCVATVDETGQPYQRIVLLKHFDDKVLGLIYTLKNFEIATSQAAVNGQFNDVLLAMNLNPLIHSDNDARLISKELLIAHKKYLPNFAKAIQQIEQEG